MALVVATIIGFTLLESPWRWVVIVIGGLVEIGEAAAMIWWSRRGRPMTGSPALLDRIGVATSECRPRGQVRVDGEIWSAVCAEGCDAGVDVRVVRVDGLELTVTPVASSP